MFIKKYLRTFALFALLFSAIDAAHAATTIEITQESSFEVYGKTTIIKPGNTPYVLPSVEYKNTDLQPGQYSVLVDPPSGSETITKLFIDGEVQVGKTSGRITFVLEDNQTAYIEILHEFNRTGKVTVSSDPQKIPFTLFGPDGKTREGITPVEYDDLPEGQYNVLYDELEGCGAQKRISDKLVKNGRIAFVMNYVCATADEMRRQKVSISDDNVTVSVNDEAVEFTDVSLDAWYADYVKDVVRGGILAGYTNENGNSTGEFGPSDAVNLAQLAKVAHKLTDIDEQNVRSEVQNMRAKGQWFEKYYASAEQSYWLAFIVKHENPGRNVTRAEVIGTLMQALGKERIWPTGNVYSDVPVFSKFADAIEIAANDGLLDKTQDTFRPNDPINRAELAKIIHKVIEVYFTEED